MTSHGSDRSAIALVQYWHMPTPWPKPRPPIRTVDPSTNTSTSLLLTRVCRVMAGRRFLRLGGALSSVLQARRKAPGLVMKLLPLGSIRRDSAGRPGALVAEHSDLARGRVWRGDCPLPSPKMA